MRSIAMLGSIVCLLASCQSTGHKQQIGGNGSGSRVSSITMPIPGQLKPYVGSDKINAYSLVIQAGACDNGVVGTQVNKLATKLGSDDQLANEKLKQGCDYTVKLSLGQAATSGNDLQKVYLTNDPGTALPKTKLVGDKINLDVVLNVTTDGAKDLGINSNNPIHVPTSTEVNATINVSINTNGSQNPSTPPPTGMYDWRSQIKWSDVPGYDFSGDFHGSAFYQDVMKHTAPADRFFGQGGWSTEAHETMHGLQASMRNASQADDGFFYFENGKGAYVLQPKKVLAKVKDYIAPNFKQEANSRYQLYLINQVQSWPDVLYIFDEWNAYVATSRSAYEMVAAENWDNQNSDPFDGIGDFIYFCSASIMAIRDNDPQYLQTNTQFKATYAMLVEASVHWITEGQKVEKWKNSSGLKRLNMLRNDAENENLRAAIRTFMGPDWTKQVMGF